MNALQRATRPFKDRTNRQGGGVRRAVVLMPNGLTLINLFCGIYAIILAVRGEFAAAPSFIVLGGLADVLDGRVARATGTGSRFGEELDSLVDAISFGLAPPLIVYLGLPNRGVWEWLLVFIFTSCAVMRLARFNVEQAGRKKTHFHGLPSPAAGLTLATYYWFSQTPLYNQAVILFTDSTTLADLPWPTILRGLMAILAALMISDVPYPTVPSIGFSSVRRVLGTLVIAGCVVLLLVRKEEFIFPALLAYVLYGAVKWVILGFLGRSTTPDEIFGTTGRHGIVAGRTDLRRPPGTGPRTTPVAQPRVDTARDERVRSRSATPVLSDAVPPSEARPQSRKRRRRRGGGGGHRPHGPGAPDSPSGPSNPTSTPDSPTGPAE